MAAVITAIVSKGLVAGRRLAATGFAGLTISGVIYLLSLARNLSVVLKLVRCTTHTFETQSATNAGTRATGVKKWPAGGCNDRQTI